MSSVTPESSGSFPEVRLSGDHLLIDLEMSQTVAGPSGANRGPVTLAAAATAAGVTDKVRDVVLTALGAFVDAPARPFLRMPDAIIESAADSVRIGEGAEARGLTPFEKSAVLTWFDDIREHFKPPVPPVSVGSTPGPADALAPKVPTTTPVVEHALIINQIDKRISETLTVLQHGEFLKRYKDKFGPRERPPMDREPTAEQLSVLQVVVDSGQVPYTDFALWGPHGGRQYRKNKLRGAIFKGDGTLGSQ